MLKFSLSLVGFLFAIGMSILVMIFGWGLQPQSWGWIIGGSVGSCIVAALIQAGAN